MPQFYELAYECAGFVGGNASCDSKNDVHVGPYGLFALAAEGNFSEHLLGVKGEVALLNPTIIARVATEDISHGHSFVFPEVEDFYAFVVINHPSCEVHVSVAA